MTRLETRRPFSQRQGRLRLLAIALSSGLAAACPVDERALQPIMVVPTTGGSSGSGAAGGAGAAEAGSNGDAGESDGGHEAGGAGTSGGSAGNAGSTVAGSAGAVGSAGRGGSSSAAGGAAGKGGSAGVCGAAGAPAPPRCPDLDINGVLDCDETVVRNATFDADADAWLADPSVATAWENADAHDNEDSGALSLENQNEDDREGGTILGVRQCLEASPGVFYRVAVELKVPEAAPATQGGFQILVYDAPACTGNIVSNVSSNLVRGSDWNVTELTYPAPAETKSIAVRLISAKPYREPPAEILFDNVLVRTE